MNAQQQTMACVTFAALLLNPGSAPAAVAPPLGAAQSFAVLGASAVSNTGPTVIIGDLGIHPNGLSSVSGFTFSTSPGPGVVVGATHFADAAALLAQNAVTTASNALVSQACDFGPLAPMDLVGQTLVPGVYCFSSSVMNTGTLTLDAQGTSNAVWVFKIGSTLITGPGSSVVFINGGQSCNVFWQVGSSATLGTTTTFVGNILATTSITMNTGATLDGRALAQTGAVTLDTNVVTASECLVVSPFAPTLGKGFSPPSINENGVSTLTITLSNQNNSAATLTSSLTDTLPTGLVIAATPNASTTCGGGSTVTAVTGGSTVTLPAGRSIPAGAPGICTVTVDVTSATADSYVNTLPAGALMTTNGDNVAPAVATLTVNPPVSADVPPTVGKSFSPLTITTGDTSIVTIILSNPNPSPATNTSLTDILPSGMVIANPADSTNDCGGTLTATAGTGTISLSGATIPAGVVLTPGSCMITVKVIVARAGSYVNTIAANALMTSNGNNTTPAIATLTVVARVLPGVPVPALSGWALLIAAALLAVVSFAAMRRQTA